MYHICFVYSFYSFQHSQLRPTSKDSQFHGNLLTLPMDSVASSWISLWHVLEVSVFLGHTALLGVWPPRPNIRLGKSREWPQGSPVSKFPRFLVAPGAQYSSGTPQKKNPEWWNPANMVASTRRRKGRKDAPWNGPAARPGYPAIFVCESLVHLLETIVGWVCQRTFNLEPARSV